MHLESAVAAFDQAIVRIGQVTVGGKAGRSAVFEQGGQAWMLLHLEAATQGIGTEPADRQRHQMVLLQAQQGDGVAGHQFEQGGEQALVAFAVRQLASQIVEQGQHGLKQWVVGHIDSN
ncbi:hypothetical protein D3C84_863060 [compost metagenome]